MKKVGEVGNDKRPAWGWRAGDSLLARSGTGFWAARVSATFRRTVRLYQLFRAGGMSVGRHQERGPKPPGRPRGVVYYPNVGSGISPLIAPHLERSASQYCVEPFPSAVIPDGARLRTSCSKL